MSTLSIAATECNVKAEAFDFRNPPVDAGRNPEQLGALLEHWYGYILQIAHKRNWVARAERDTLPLDDEDLAQLISLEVIRRLRRASTPILNFPGWLWYISRIVASRFYGLAKGRSARAKFVRLAKAPDGGDPFTTLPDAGDADPSEVVESRDYWAWTMRVLDGNQRRAVVLMFRNDLNYREMGEQDGATRQNAHYHARNAMSRLKTLAKLL